MERMHGIDAFSIYSASSTSPFATLKVLLYEPVDESDVPDIHEVRRFVMAQVERLGAGVAGMRIVRVPFDLHHPVWVSDPAYSPDDHVYETALPAPGDKAQLCEFLSDLMGRPLDPDRPLWEVWLVEGLQGGRIAVAIKVHHALADGQTIAALVARSHSKAVAGEGSPERTEGEPIPGRLRLIRDALVDLFTTYTDELPQFYRELKQARAHADQIETTTDTGPGRTDAAQKGMPPAPFTVFNERAGGRYRVYRYETFSLTEFKRLTRVFDCTLNTLVVGVCSEALKRYLRDVETLPSTSLLTAMPVGGDRGGRARRTRLHRVPPHNSVAVAVLPLHQDIEDFAERLQAIQRSSKAAIDRVQRSYGKRFDNLLEFLPGTFIRWTNALLERQQARRKSAYANVVISNVAGPRKPLHALDGRLRMVELLSTGNITDLGNLNITVWSYVDNLCFSFYMRKAALPEPDKIPGYVKEVVEEIQKGVVTGETGAPAG
jgi:diacylglycerol O-acyltransferase